VRLDFEDLHGGIKTVYAVYQPLGIIIGEHPPVEVLDFTINSHARELHVQHGWKLVGIGNKDDEEVEELKKNKIPEFKQKDVKEVNELLFEKVEGLPLYPLYIRFQTSMDSLARVVAHKFVHYPLGLEFANEAPIRITEVLKHGAAATVHGESAENKIEKGWFITGIGNKPVGRITNFKEVEHYLKEGLRPLADYRQKQGVIRNVIG